jgi:hypothetical protein
MATYVIGFAVAGLAVIVAGLVLLTSILQQRVSALALSQSTTAKSLRTELEQLAATRPDSTPVATLVVRVDDLAAAVDELSARHRKFAGKVWGRIGGEEAKPTAPLDRNELRRQHLPKPNGV